MEEATDEPLYRDRVCGIDIGKAGLVATIRGAIRRATRLGGCKRPAASAPLKEQGALARGLAAEGGARGGDGGNRRLLEGGRSTGWRPRGSTACWPTPSRSRTCRAARSGTLSDSRWLAACFERGAITSCFVATPEFRMIRSAHPLPGGTLDRGAHPAEAARGEAAGISGDQDLPFGPDRPARGHRPGHHGSLDRRGAQP